MKNNYSYKVLLIDAQYKIKQFMEVSYTIEVNNFNYTTKAISSSRKKPQGIHKIQRNKIYHCKEKKFIKLQGRQKQENWKTK